MAYGQIFYGYSSLTAAGSGIITTIITTPGVTGMKGLNTSGLYNGTTLSPGTIGTIQVGSAGVWAVSYSVSYAGYLDTDYYDFVFSIKVQNSSPTPNNPTRCVVSAFGTGGASFANASLAKNRSLLQLNANDVLTLVVSINSIPSDSQDLYVFSADLCAERIY